MMDHVEAELRTRDCPKINLQVRTSNAEVAAFYERRGYAIDQVISFGKSLGGDADSSVD
jgi:ribosomal protein S18 acetylase RimI-like enzyme